MLHLTPQERFALSCLLTIFCVGILISIGLNRDARFVQWVRSAHQVHQAGPLDLNKATVDQLEKLPGIGLKMAGRIVDYRRAYGDFASVDELMRVKGMTKRNFMLLREKLTK